MQPVPVAEAKARLSSMLAAVEAGEEVVITRRGRVVARLVPEGEGSAADLFRSLPAAGEIDLEPAVDGRPDTSPRLD